MSLRSGLSRRNLLLAAAFATSAALLVGTLLWLSRLSLRLEARQRQARQTAAFEERVRLALWRMDAAAGALLARENARPIQFDGPALAAAPASAAREPRSRAAVVETATGAAASDSTRARVAGRGGGSVAGAGGSAAGVGGSVAGAGGSMPAAGDAEARTGGSIAADPLAREVLTQNRLNRAEFNQRWMQNQAVPTPSIREQTVMTPVTPPAGGAARSQVAGAPGGSAAGAGGSRSGAGLASGRSGSSGSAGPPSGGTHSGAAGSSLDDGARSADAGPVEGDGGVGPAAAAPPRPVARELQALPAGTLPSGVGMAPGTAPRRSEGQQPDPQQRVERHAPLPLHPRLARHPAAPVAGATASAVATPAGPLAAAWVGADLMLTRRVRRGTGEWVQRVWLDGRQTRGWLLAQVRDLLPAAALLPLPATAVPAAASATAATPANVGIAAALANVGIAAAAANVRTGAAPASVRTDAAPANPGTAANVGTAAGLADLAGDPGRRLALLPLRLDPGPPPPLLEGASSPLRWGLLVAFAAVLLALAAAGWQLAASERLARRRADFVSAVTHELRTPLTTFRLYTELLAGGMVPAVERQSYLETLKTEADRLGHLVENVLGYARLERGGGAPAALESLALAPLVEQAAGRLAPRLRQGGLVAAVEIAAGAGEARVRVDRLAFERILENLADNAAKYARNPADPRLHIAVRLDDRRAVAIVALADHGPGVERAARRRLFAPFHRSAAAAAGAPPGVGLGLALSRHLARSFGGDLRLAEHPAAPRADVAGAPAAAAPDIGAVFELELPLETG